MMRSLATVSGMTLLSRVFGFVRQVLIAGVIGAGGNPVADAFWAAFRLPNMFRRLFAEGAFHAAFIPLFQDRAVNPDKDERVFAEEVLSGLLAVVLTLTVIVEIFAPFFVYLIAGGFIDDPEKFDLTVLYTRIMFPYLACMSLVGLFGGILNSFDRFAASAGAPLLLNFCLIAGLLLYATRPVEVAGLATAWAVLAGGVAQLLLLIWAIRRQDFTLRLRMPRLTPGVRRLLVLGGPGFLSAGALQINLIVGTNIASREPGAVSWLMNADALYQLPLAVIGIALGSVLLPGLSRQVKAGNETGAVAALNRSLEVAALFTLPAACAFLVMAAPICDALYRGLAADSLALVGVSRSAFTTEDVAMTGAALALFGLGLPAFVWQKVFQPAFFAREDTRTPMAYALLSIIINIALAVSLFPVFGFLSIPVATAAAAWVQIIAMAIALLRRRHFRPDRRLGTRLVRMLAASAAMGFGLVYALTYRDSLANIFWNRDWLAVIVIAAMGAVFYFALAFILGAIRPKDWRQAARGTGPAAEPKT